MAFNDLSVEQHELIAALIERLASADFCSKFRILSSASGKLSITLKGFAGAPDAQLGDCEPTDLKVLEENGYISISGSEAPYLGELSSHAYKEYQSSRYVSTVFGLVPHTSREGGDDRMLERLAERSELLRRDLHRNIELYRRQASLSFLWTLIISTIGMALLCLGIALSLVGKATTVNIASISGIITEFLAAVFFKRAADAQKAQDRSQNDLLSRQRILDLVDLTRLISDDSIRDAVTQDLIKAFVLGSHRAAVREDDDEPQLS